jgi:GNAT superfamily N-acetyltransferase
MPIRRATPEDIPAIIALQRRIHAEHVAYDARRWTIRDAPPDVVYDEWLRELLADHEVSGLVLVAASDAGAVVGYLLSEVTPEASREWSPACIYVHDVYVALEARRQGFARSLMAECIEWARRTRPDWPVRLLTAGPNESGRAFFASMGFRVCAVEMMSS